MSKRQVAVTRGAQDALSVLGQQVRLGRHARRWSVADLAARLGVNPRTVSSLEAGTPGVAIGTVFNAALLVGVDLFGLDGPELARARRAGADTLALLPAKVRKATVTGSPDDFDF